MSDPTVQAFFVGRALAESLREQAELVLTNLLSEVGKFDAEQRQNLRYFTEQVLTRASQDVTQAAATPMATAEDLQATLDDLRAEIAQLRSALQAYRGSTP